MCSCAHPEGCVMADVRCDNNPDGEPTGFETGRCHNCGSNELRHEDVDGTWFGLAESEVVLAYVCGFCGLLHSGEAAKEGQAVL